MRNFLKGALNTQARKDRQYRELIRKEAKIGGELFGPVPQGGRREFFCLDEHTWVWHEEWLDKAGARHAVTTRYDVRPGHGIFKAQDGQPYVLISPEEARSFYKAIKIYNKRVKHELYSDIAA